MKKILTSLKNINIRLYLALLVLGVCPTIYMTIRVFFIGQLPGEYAFSIAGQLSWVDLIYEILSEAIILPLFFFMGKVVADKKEFANCIKTGLIMSFSVYTVLSVGIVVFIEELLSIMAVDTLIVGASAQYIRIESVAKIFAVLSEFILVSMVTIGKEKCVYIFTGIKMLLSVFCDTFFISTLPISLKLGVNGIAISNIMVNFVLFALSIVLLYSEGIKIITKDKLSFGWMKEFIKVGGISGVETFVRNIAYMLMVSRMVNVVGEQGTYWVANNFIWGWLLLPILQLGELIKKEVAADSKAVKNNTLGYLAITIAICGIWFVTIPLWKPFMVNVLRHSDVDKLFELVIVLVGFYVFYAFQNIFDATFY